MGFGQTLREAREAKGFTVEQLAEATHIMARTINGLEAEDFSSIVAPIYGRGFVKICCQTLGLDPKPMVDEFMAIYNGEKQSAFNPISVNTPPPAAPAEPEPVEIPASEEPQANAPLGDLFAQRSEPQAVKQPVSRFAPPQPQDDGRAAPFTMPAIPWRLVLLIVGTIVVIWALIAGCISIYRSLGTAESETTAPTPVMTVKQPKADGVTTPAVKRAPKPVKPLYID